MPVLETALDVRTPEAQANATAMQALLDDLRARADRIRQGGGESARKRHLARGKLLPRDRVRALLDPGIAVPRARRSSPRTACMATTSRPPASSPASAASRAANA